jgi:hypothetical protein
MTAFKMGKYLKKIRMVARGIRINCNAGSVMSNKKGPYGQLNVWYIPNGFSNIFSMHKLEKQYCFTYDSWVGYYSVHAIKGVVKFHKNKQGLPYFDLDGLSKEAAIMLMQMIEVQGVQECATEGSMHVQTVRGSYEGYTKREIKQSRKQGKPKQ